MLLYFAPYCVKKPPKDKPTGQARRPRAPQLLCGGASTAMPTFFALSGTKYGYPKCLTYLLNIT